MLHLPHDLDLRRDLFGLDDERQRIFERIARQQNASFGKLRGPDQRPRRRQANRVASPRAGAAIPGFTISIANMAMPVTAAAAMNMDE